MRLSLQLHYLSLATSNLRGCISRVESSVGSFGQIAIVSPLCYVCDYDCANEKVSAVSTGETDMKLNQGK